MCKIGGILHGRLINAEFYLQRASHNSYENNQRQVDRKYAKYGRYL